MDCFTEPLPQKSYECALKLTDLWITGLFFYLNFLTGASLNHFNLFFYPCLNLYIIFHMLYLHSCHMIRFFQIETVSQDFTHFFTGLHQPENSQCTFLFHRVFHMLFRPITVSTNFTYFSHGRFYILKECF